MGTIVVQDLGKAYKTYKNRWGRLAEWVLPGKIQHKLHWVVRDINFTVNSGEAVGIIGINGAGKSTLLKMITGTTHPTLGSVQLSGRVAAMLELGMGFHPDFTGRQNVIMAGQLLGHGVETIHHLMPEIEAFAEIGEYIDQPVRVYSSGMQVRLAFSVATAIRPDILIIDEALSVGDAYFQHKSFDRIRKFRADGTTLLIVSHDKGAIQSICDRAILINSGKLEFEGPPEAVMDYYNALLSGNTVTVRQESTEKGLIKTISGSNQAQLEIVELLNIDGEPVELVRVDEEIILRLVVRANEDLPELVVGYALKDRLGQVIYGTNTYHLSKVEKTIKKGELIEYLFSYKVRLGPGTYSIATALHAAQDHLGQNYEWRDLALVFQVFNAGKDYFVGTSWLPPTLAVTRDY